MCLAPLILVVVSLGVMGAVGPNSLWGLRSEGLIWTVAKVHGGYDWLEGFFLGGAAKNVRVMGCTCRGITFPTGRD